jgi:hypothetical protein
MGALLQSQRLFHVLILVHSRELLAWKHHRDEGSDDNGA